MSAGQLTRAPWRQRPAAQQPHWPDPVLLAEVTARLAAAPAPVRPGEIRSLGRALAAVAGGRAFVVQAGDCAETLDGPTLDAVAAAVRVVQAAARRIAEALGLPVVSIGRIAGQYAKPRSLATEWVSGEELPSFRGHLVNSPERLLATRMPDPLRLLRGHQHARAVVELLRRLASTGLPMPGWDAGLALWTSHEALVLDYEEPFRRPDPATGAALLTSTHLPWIGVRTGDPEGAHVALLAGVSNPVGYKVGPGLTPETLVAVCRRLDPDRRPGRLVLIGRFGAGLVAERLPGLVAAVRAAGHPAVWLCDPMHGNTVTTSDGRKTRHLSVILAELTGFFAAVREAGGWPGGVHLETTAEQVTECLSSGEADLSRRYTTACDPRLNPQQTDEVAGHVAGLCVR
jgi:3-deoxy-7-phosphoheptulonate synthase